MRFRIWSSLLNVSLLLCTVTVIAEPSFAADFRFFQTGWNAGGQRNNPDADSSDVVLTGSFSGDFDGNRQIRVTDLTEFSIHWPGDSFVPAFSASVLPEGSQFCYGLNCTDSPGLSFYFKNELPSLNVTQVSLTSGDPPVGVFDLQALGELSNLIQLSYVTSSSPVFVEPIGGGLLDPSVIVDQAAASVSEGANAVIVSEGRAIIALLGVCLLFGRRVVYRRMR